MKKAMKNEIENEMEELLKNYKTGRIKKVITNKGYGFIENIEGGRDIFFHVYNCITKFEDLIQGQIVQFKVIETEKGFVASEITVVK